MRALGVALATLAAAVAPAVAHGAPTLLDGAGGCGPALDSVDASDCQAPVVSAYGGWSAWSHADTATGQFALTLRAPSGAISAAPVAESGAPLDVELGPAGGGRVAAVFSRCASTVTYAGCHLEELPLGGGGERTLAPPVSGSLHMPAIWNGRLVFLRRDPAGGSEDYYHPTARRPDQIFSWRIGASSAQAVKLPSSLGSRGAGWPAGLTGVITGLTLEGGQLAYVTSTGVQSSSFEFSMFTLWYQLLGQGPRLIDQATAGEGNVCVPRMLSPTIVGNWLYAYLHACDPSANAGLDRWTRYGLHARTAQRARFAFVGSAEEGIFAVVPDGGGVVWNDGAVHRLGSVSWRTIARPAPASFCSHSDLFC
jgi:hypothetical protein